MVQEEDGTIRVVAAIADKHKVILYKEDGDTVTVSQGDVRLQALMDEIIPVTARGEVAVVSLKKFSVYADFAKQSNGVVRFYKAKRHALGSLTGAHTAGGEVVVVNMEFTPDITPEQMTALLGEAKEYVSPWLKGATAALAPLVTAPILAAVDMEVTKITVKEGGPGQADTAVTTTTKETVVERLEPVTGTNHEDDLQDDEIIVAVIGNTLIPDVDKLRPYILHAVKTNSIQAVENFLKRVATVIERRSHSVLDLMRFLQHGDLPLADDGSILAYKVLRKTAEEGVYVDCHTQKVKQSVGSFVCVDDKLVDPSRHNECSHGLHIARRGYLHNFSGDVCTLCKIAPEDVMVVPHGDPNKVRVTGYHILSVVTPDGWAKLKTGKPFTSESADQMTLLSAITGAHVDRLIEVKIHGQLGTDVRTTNLVIPILEKQPKKAKTSVPKVPAKALKKASSLDQPAPETAPVIEPRAMNKRINAEIAKNQKAKKTNGKAKPGAKARKSVNWDKAEKDFAAVMEPKMKALDRAKKAKAKPEAVAAPQPNGSLSKEQKQALVLLGKGVSQSEVARQTGISRRSLGRLVEKYGTNT